MPIIKDIAHNLPYNHTTYHQITKGIDISLIIILIKKNRILNF